VAATNLEERKAIYDKIQAILLDDLPFAPIFSYQTIVGVKDRVKGYAVNPYLTSNAWNTADWTTA
jgi:peptide/nickel transport system substrate-binding protein